MEKFINWFNGSQWLNLIFLSIAILSIFVSIYLFRKSRKLKKPVFDKRSLNVISDSIKRIGDIEVKYKGNKVENLTVTKVAFWNSGNDTINDNDQAPTDKLRISVDNEFEILESEIVFQTDKTNNIQIDKQKNEVQISFDYLDPNHGGIIKFVHTGRSSSNVNLIGTFKGSAKLKRLNSGVFNLSASIMVTLPLIGKIFESEKEKKIMQKLFPWVVLATGIVFGSAYFLVDSEENGRIALLILGIIYGFLGLAMVFGNKSMPKGFEIFYDDE